MVHRQVRELFQEGKCNAEPSALSSNALSLNLASDTAAQLMPDMVKLLPLLPSAS